MKNKKVLDDSLLLPNTYTEFRFMKRTFLRLIPLFLLPFVLIGMNSCESSDDNQSSVDSETIVSGELKDLPPAVQDPKREDRVMNDFESRALVAEGLPIEMDLPSGIVVKYDRDLNGWLIFNEDESFKLVAVSDQTASEDIAQYWRSNPEDYRFRTMKIQTPNGILFEVERNGKVEYHVDYSIMTPEFLRIYSAKDRPFSQYQAEKMFHACRTIKGKVEVAQ